IATLLVAMLVVHPDWSLADGQFGWMLLIIFTTVLIAGPGRFSLFPKY
ncbi:LysR family transcriptional regulator, partial [Escherichia coli]